MKKTYLINALTSIKKGLANSITEDGKALVSEIQAIITEMEADTDVEFNAEDVMAKVSELAKKAGAEAAAEVASSFEGKFKKIENKMDKSVLRNSFATALRNSAGKGKGAFAEEFKTLCVENGITGLPSMLEVFPEIQTKFEQTSILSKLRKLGNYSIKIGVSVQEDSDTDVRAKGHVEGAQKGDQSLELTPKTISLGAIYKKISVPKLVSYQTGDDTALFQWLANELVERIDNEIQRVILVGDGRANNHADKISSFETIGTKTATDAYTVYATVTNALPTLAQIRAVVDQMDNSKPITMYAHPAVITDLQEFIYGAGCSVQYITDETLASQLGINEIVRTKMLAGAVPGAASVVPAIVLIQHDSYGYVGSDLFSVNYELWEYNNDVLLSEIFAGGAIIKPLSTGLVTITKS